MSAAVLDVEDDDQRQKRIGALLERLDTAHAVSPTSPDPLLNIAHKHSPAPTPPPAALLARVQAFLPAISASNEALARQRPEDVDIEHLGGDETQYIEMNLGLGVFEAKRRRRSGDPGVHTPDTSSDEDSASDRATASSSQSESESDAESYDSSEYSAFVDSSSGSDSDSAASVEIQPVSSRLIKPLPRRTIVQQAQAKLEV